MALLEVDRIDAYYGAIHVLHGVSLSVAENRVTALLGRNGVGKSTTLKSMMGLTRIGSGRITYRGQDLTGKRSDEIARMGIGYVPEERRIFTSMSVLDNLLAGCRSDRATRQQDLERVYSLFPVLARKRKHYGDQLSGGEQQMLAIARTLMTRPQLLLLDEPCEGLAPSVVKEMAKTVERLLTEGYSLLLVEQSLRLAPTLADTAVVLNKGMLCYAGDIQTLMSDADMMKQFLGVGA